MPSEYPWWCFICNIQVEVNYYGYVYLNRLPYLTLPCPTLRKEQGKPPKLTICSCPETVPTAAETKFVLRILVAMRRKVPAE
jgi:hypothetical protein